MNHKIIILAVEDILSDAVCTKILENLGIIVCQRIGLKGKGYLGKKANSLNQTAKGFPVFMLTDMDSPASCPPELIQSWIKGEQNPNFFLRVAVMEVESWILADRRGMSNFLSVPLSKIPINSDEISHPKEFLTSVARLSKKKSVRDEIVPAPGSTSTVGPGYNIRIGEFVRNHWNIELAGSISMSLKRTLDRLKDFNTL